MHGTAVRNQIIKTIKQFSGSQISDSSLLSDLNNADINTIYRINIPFNDVPNNCPTKNAILITFGYNKDNVDTLCQAMVSYLEDVIYYRIKWNNSWTDWKKISNNINLEKLIESPFEGDGNTKYIFSNIQIVGMKPTDQRLAISNIRHHYNSEYNAFHIYKIDDDDIENVTNLHAGIEVNNITDEKGTIIIDLSTIIENAKISIDYDFSTVTDTSRYTPTGKEILIKKSCYNFENDYVTEIPIDYTDFGFIRDFAVIGDSYASGEIYTENNSSSTGYSVQDYYELSWGQILARKSGANCINLSKGGLTTRTWLTDEKGLQKMLNENQQELYICALGINDMIKDGVNYIGSINDIKEDYTQNADTFYGNYGKIISQINNYAPNAKIIMLTFAYNYSNNENLFNEAIKNIAEHFNLPCIDIKDDKFFAQDSIYHTGKRWNHPTAPIYAGMAVTISRLFNNCIIENYNYFRDFIG